MPISHTWSLALLKPAAAVRIQGVGYSEGNLSATDLGSLETLRSLGVRYKRWHSMAFGISVLNGI